MFIVTGMSIAEAVDAYLADLGRRGRREHTLRGYRSDLAVLVECARAGNGALDDVLIASYVSRLQALAPATRARHRAALRGFLRWAGREDLLGPAAGQAVAADGRSGRVSRAAATRADVDAVLGMIPRRASRDRLLFGLLAGLGLRPGEALALRADDFDESAESLHVAGWGGLRRWVLVDDPQLLLQLANFTQLVKGEGYLFTASGRTTPLRYQSVLERWSRYTAAAGVTIRLGDLRRLHAEELLAGGVPEAVVRVRLGQQSRPLTDRPVTRPVADETIRAWRSRSTLDPTAPQHTRTRNAG